MMNENDNLSAWELITTLAVIFIVGFLLYHGFRWIITVDSVVDCRDAGYTWYRVFAGTPYCLRIEDETLIGVKLETLLED